MTVAPDDLWSQDELEGAALAVNHHLSALTFAVTHNKLPKRFGYTTAVRRRGLVATCRPSLAGTRITAGFGRAISMNSVVGEKSTAG